MTKAQQAKPDENAAAVAERTLETATAPESIVFIGPHTWWNQQVHSARAGERRLVTRADFLRPLVECGSIPAVFEKDLPRVTPCPRCYRPLRKTDIKKEPPVRRRLLRATCDVPVLPHDGQVFSLRAGELVLLAENVVETIRHTLLPGTLEETGYALFRAHCRTCNGPVEVALLENE